MKVIVYINEKGGVGKSGLSVHNSWYTSGQGYRVGHIDLDSQRNSSFTLSAHEAEGITSSQLFDANPLPSFTPTGDLTLIAADKKLILVDRAELSSIAHFLRNLKSLEDRFDVLVIDTAPGKSIRTTAALFAADYVVAPVQVESYSVLGTKELLQDILGVQQRRKQNNAGELVFLGMLPNLVNNTSPMHRDNLKLMVTNYAKYMLPCKISNRTSIGEALAAKKPVWAIEKSAAREAAKEIKHAMETIQTLAGIPKKEKEKA